MPSTAPELISELCEQHRLRLTGSDAERRAADWLATSLRAEGRTAAVEPVYTHPQVALVHALHCAIALIASLIAPAAPEAAFAMALFAAASLYLDLNGRLYLLRRLFFRRLSQNVVSPGTNPDAPQRLVICANYDAGRTGFAFSEGVGRLWGRIATNLPLTTSPIRLLFWSIASLLPVIAARAAGVSGNGLDLAQLPPTLALLTGVLLLAEIELSRVGPAANDNASGAVGALELVRRLRTAPPAALDVWVVLTGGGEATHEGMWGFLRGHKADLDRDRTRFLALDAIGRGPTRYELSAGWAVSFGSDPRMIELSQAIAETEESDPAKPWRNATGTESLPPRILGYGAISIAGRDRLDRAPGSRTAADIPAAISLEDFDRNLGFAEQLIRQLDRDAERSS